ncbi:MAG: AbgT family transporter [bacterium]|nr:AbgT family transporter [bacterium]
MFKRKRKPTPIMTFITLSIITIVLSGFLHLLNVQAEYSTVNKVTGELVNNVVEVKNLFSVSGIRNIVTSAVNNFVNFEPLSTLIIILIGIGVLEKSGFMKTAITLMTKNTKKFTVTFSLIFICLLFSLLGNIGFAIMLPLGALLFKYGRRNPLGGIIATFSALSFGSGINIFLSSMDSSILSLTLNAARTIDTKYTIGTFFALFIMIFMLIVVAFVFTNITEKKIMPRLPRLEDNSEEVVITNKELRGLIIGLACGFVYILIITYMIIPGLPLSGGLLDNNAEFYIDKLFGSGSLFNKGFIFIVTILFIIIGFGYGLMSKTIKNSKDATDSLSYSLDGIGSILVLIFFASLFINIVIQSNIGNVLVAFFANIISGIKFTGIPLILLIVIFVAIANIICPDSLIKWNILVATVVPLLLNASISPEFSQIIYSAGDSMTNGITPVFTYFVIYIAFLNKYYGGDIMTMKNGVRCMVPYSIFISIVWIVVLVGWYMLGVPIGIGSIPGVVYGA